MLLGEFQTQIGEKNRIAIPKKLRSELTGELVITRGYENCLLILDQTRWSSFIAQINKRPLLSLDVRDTKRFILGGAVEINPDLQGRFVLPESLKTFASLDSDVTFIGVGEWIEIWDSQKWLNKLKDLSSKVSDIAERLE